MGQERYARNMMPMYYRGAQAAILVYDITSVSSFNSLPRWLRDIKEHRQVDDIVLAVVGNKTDCANDREVSVEQGQEFAEKNGMMFVETSAKTGENIEELFCAIARKLRSRRKESQGETITMDTLDKHSYTQPTQQKREGRCCAFNADMDYSPPDSPQTPRKVPRQPSSPGATGPSSPLPQTPTKSPRSLSMQGVFHANPPVRSLSYPETKSSPNRSSGKRKSKTLSKPL